MNQVIHTKMSDGRRIAIPAEMCKEYGLKPGGPVVLEPSDAGIVVRPRDAVVREVQAFFADAAPAGVILSEELSLDRKAEAAREKRG
jgi:bifunctional DNA-binding transcriptional regulator/antitoxin component of YhaV-PrlF toxin-antitoxin module